MEDLAAAMRDLAASMNAVKTTVGESQTILREIGTWKPQVDGALQEPRSDITTLRQQLGRVALNPILGLDPSTLQARAIPAALEGGGVAAAVNDGDGRGPAGHRVHLQPRGMSTGGDPPPATPPAMGMCHNSENLAQFTESSEFLHRGGSNSSGSHLPRPKMDFPVFEGERPKTWKRQCESYFRVFSINSEHWVDTATMHFMGGALLWLENCGLDVERLNWVELCKSGCGQFGKDEFQKLLRQLFPLKQVGSVAEYIQEFMEDMHSLRAHSSAWDPFPSRFVDGLKDEIKVAIMVLSEPSALPGGDSLNISSIYKHQHDHAQLDGMWTGSDFRDTEMFREQSTYINYKLQAGPGRFDIIVPRLGEMDQHVLKHKSSGHAQYDGFCIVSMPLHSINAHVGDLVIWSFTVPCGVGAMQPIVCECQATGLPAEHTSDMIFPCSIGPTVVKQFAQAGANLCLGLFLVYPMGTQWRRQDDQVGCVDSSSLTVPWDPGKLLCLEIWFTRLAASNYNSHLPTSCTDCQTIYIDGGILAALLVDRLGGKPVFNREGMSRTGLRDGLRWTLGWSLGPN